MPSYLVGRPEGYAVLDALRAAQRIDGSGVSERSPVGISGYSQGGQAAGWAAELLGDYAPELRLKGVLAGGVPTDMLTEVNHLNGNPTAGAGFAVAALVGLDHAHPELGLAARLTPEGEQAVERVENSCVFEDYLTFGTLTTGDVTQPDVLADPRWQKRFAESRLGTRKPAAPAYVYHGTSDTLVPFSQGSRLYHDWCARGQSVQFEALSGVDHVPGIVLGPPRGVEWLVVRLNGGTTPEGCNEVGLG
nr:lipase family protein [Streptomyces tailanensis]